MGGYSEGEPPVPIPNTEVKPFSADGTAYSGRVGRRPLSRGCPKNLGGLFFYLIKYYIFLENRKISKRGSVDPQTWRTRYTHWRLRSAYLSIKRNAHLLWMFYDKPDLNIPDTSNGIEALSTDLKYKLRVHNGLCLKNRAKFIDLYLFNKQNVGILLTNK